MANTVGAARPPRRREPEVTAHTYHRHSPSSARHQHRRIPLFSVISFQRRLLPLYLFFFPDPRSHLHTHTTNLGYLKAQSTPRAKRKRGLLAFLREPLKPLLFESLSDPSRPRARNHEVASCRPISAPPYLSP